MTKIGGARLVPGRRGGGKWSAVAAILLGCFSQCFAGISAADFSERCADRAAIERVYHAQRTGANAAFEQAMPAALLESLVREDAKKEALLGRTYGVKITDEMIQAELRRIEATSRAPAVLAEIRAALGGDPARFARAMARPILVETALRARFANDDSLHAPQRRTMEMIRERMLAADSFSERLAAMRVGHEGSVEEQAWSVAPRASTENAGLPAMNAASKNAAASASYSLVATAQIATMLAPPERADRSRDTLYFEDLDPQLQKILHAQLHDAGDVSAVIETPAGFLLFLASAKPGTALSAHVLTLRKLSLEAWLAAQPEP